MKCLGFDNVWIHISIGENVAWIDHKPVCPYVAPSTTPCVPQAWGSGWWRTKPFRACPKTVACGRGGQWSSAQHSWEQLCPLGGLPPAPHPGEAPSQGPGLSQITQLLGAAGPWRLVPCPCTEGYKCSVGGIQGGTWACSCGAPGKQPCIFTETLDVLSFGSPLTGAGEGGPGTAVLPHPASPLLPAALWGTGQRRGSAGQGLVLSRDPGCTWNCHKQDIDRGDHLSPRTYWSRWPNLCTQW